MYTDIFRLIFYVTLFLLAIFTVSEVFFPRYVQEGFSMLPTSTYWSTFAAPRADVGPTSEDSDYVRDPRYFNGYADVSRLGVSYDFCRMVVKKGTEDLFFACALAGTENLDSIAFRTGKVSQGFRVSKDDYMRDINSDGRTDYCRILFAKDGTYQPLCVRATDSGFDARDVVDPNPPEDILQMLSFYEGCELWLRFDHSLDDIVQSVNVQTAGKVTIDEMPSPTADGVTFNGVNQYLRIYDEPGLTLGTIVPLRSIRAWMVWVYYDEFTNNAKIFDFGNGPNADNVFMGILGKGDYGTQSMNDSTVPTEPSGQQQVEETTPKRMMETSEANLDFECKGIEVFPRKLPHSTVSSGQVATNNATLLYEVWDKSSRKMRLTVNNVIPLKQWTHIVITADSQDAFRPALNVFINGVSVYKKLDGCLPSTDIMTNCFIAKSNWRSTTLYSNQDTLLKGSLFDFRAYSVPLSEDLIQQSYSWGKGKLGISTELP